eukprot:5410448-Pyramimonas_sp.AAC.1
MRSSTPLGNVSPLGPGKPRISIFGRFRKIGHGHLLYEWSHKSLQHSWPPPGKLKSSVSELARPTDRPLGPFPT